VLIAEEVVAVQPQVAAVEVTHIQETFQARHLSVNDSINNNNNNNDSCDDDDNDDYDVDNNSTVVMMMIMPWL
jgi:hypothetical protein